MFSKLFTIAIAIIFWPVTLLIFGWAMLHTLLSTKINYTPPTDPETGKLLKSFYFGGEWEEINPPNHDELTTAWMFLLADCEDIDPKLAPEKTRELLERTINLLWLGEGEDVEEDQPSPSDSCIPTTALVSLPKQQRSLAFSGITEREVETTTQLRRPFESLYQLQTRYL